MPKKESVMSKSQTLAVAAVSAVIVACTGIIGIPWLPWLFVYILIVSLLWYGYKRLLHARLLKEAKADAQKQLPPVIVMTTPGSSRLFVPQPLDK
jgi:ABC-type multidrug transport system permease subunit